MQDVNSKLLEDEFSPKARVVNIKKLKNENFDILIIGGGAVGAGTACEAISRGFKVALIEMGDFGSGTSSKTSKLLHGGLRYLEKLNVGLVFEALKDRNILFNKAPYIAKAIPFIVPVYKGYKEPLFVINIGLAMYDVLSSISNKAIEKWHKYLNKKGLKELEPSIRDEGLKGGVKYFDGFCDDARLTLEVIKTAAKKDTATIANYIKVTGFKINDEDKDKNIVRTAIVKDVLSGEEFEIKAKRIVNASGPWVDAVNNLEDKNYVNKLKPTKGIHIIVPKLTQDNALLLKTHKKPVRWIFIIPYGEHSIIGTTDTESTLPENDYSFLDNDNYATKEEVQYLIDAANHFYPSAKLTEKDIISSFGGWRPLVAPPKHKKFKESDISRRHEIFETKSGIICITGGKLTTYMSMSKDVVDHLVQKEEFSFYKDAPYKFLNLSNWQLSKEFDEFLKNELAKHKTEDHKIVETLINKYGTEYHKIFRIMEVNTVLKEKIKDLSDNISCFKAEILYSVLFEMSLTVKDFMMRRHRIILQDKNQGLNAVNEIAEIMSYAIKDNLCFEDDERIDWVKKQVQEYKEEVEKINNYRKG